MKGLLRILKMSRHKTQTRSKHDTKATNSAKKDADNSITKYVDEIKCTTEQEIM